jgi:L-ribulose-5-phosphate 4-epimerase
MTWEQLQIEAYEGNMQLPQRELVIYTWGNVSRFSKELDQFAIKPSGIAYEKLTAQDLPVIDLTGARVHGDKNPSSDTMTHIVLYQNWGEVIGAVVHVHSPYATAFAQAGLPIPCFGTTHADYFYGDIPVTRPLTQQETEEAYEENTGRVIVECFSQGGRNPVHAPGVLVYGHGPFAWGKDANEAVMNAAVIEQVAKMAYVTLGLNPAKQPLEAYTQDKHFLRKHGPNATYGQREETQKG